VKYYEDFVAPSKTYRAPTEAEREALQELRDQLAGYDGPVEDEALQAVVYAVGRDRFDPLRDWFRAIYEVLLGASQGPRFGGFIAWSGGGLHGAVDAGTGRGRAALHGKLRAMPWAVGHGRWALGR
jgi:lysyl-tRNA synthetase class I